MFIYVAYHKMNPLIVLMFLYPMTLQLRMCSTDRSTSTLTLVMVSDLLETSNWTLHCLSHLWTYNLNSLQSCIFFRCVK